MGPAGMQPGPSSWILAWCNPATAVFASSSLRTENGDRVVDLLMSLIRTTQRCGGNPFEYITALQRHADLVCFRPGEWLPWNNEATLAALWKADKS